MTANRAELRTDNFHTLAVRLKRLVSGDSAAAVRALAAAVASPAASATSEASEATCDVLFIVCPSRPWLSTCDRVGRQQLVGERLPTHLVGPIRAVVEPLQRGLDAGQVAFDLLEVDRHPASVVVGTVAFGCIVGVARS